MILRTKVHITRIHTHTLISPRFLGKPAQGKWGGAEVQPQHLQPGIPDFPSYQQLFPTSLSTHPPHHYREDGATSHPEGVQSPRGQALWLLITDKLWDFWCHHSEGAGHWGCWNFGFLDLDPVCWVGEFQAIWNVSPLQPAHAAPSPALRWVSPVIDSLSGIK